MSAIMILPTWPASDVGPRRRIPLEPSPPVADLPVASAPWSFGLPAAVGAALANPDRKVICFSGDGWPDDEHSGNGDRGGKPVGRQNYSHE